MRTSKNDNVEYYRANEKIDEKDLEKYTWEGIFSIKFGCDGQYEVLRESFVVALNKLNKK